MIYTIIASIVLSIVTVLADVLIKRASLKSHWSGWQELLLAAIIYGTTAFGWFFLMRRAKLSSLGAIYSIIIIITLVLVSVFYFKEKISLMEIVGFTMAVISLIILYRFA